VKRPRRRAFAEILCSEPQNFTGATIMTSYTDLQNLYTAWADATEMHKTCGRKIIDKFQRGLFAYLAAPPDTIRFHKVDHNETGLARYQEPPTHFINVIERQEDGAWNFCMSVMIQHKNSTLPNLARYFFEINLALRESEYELCFLNDAKKTFKYKVEDDSTFDDAYAYICQVLAKTFQRKPWEGYEKGRIGFDLTPTSG
jgi:hypothetical protein